MLYGALHPNDICSAGNWREMVIPIIEDILAREQTPIICGGTGLYIKALMQGLSPIPDIPNEVRTRAIEIQDTETIEELYKGHRPTGTSTLKKSFLSGTCFMRDVIKDLKSC